MARPHPQRARGRSTPAAGRAAPAGKRSRRDTALNVLVVLCCAGCLAFNLWAVSVGWSYSLLDQHGFRQTQTAISTFWLLRGSPWLAYETPVLGPPWSIPFEFPLYQWTVAVAVQLTALPLDQAGRLVALLYFYLTLPPAFWVLGRLGVRRMHRLVFLALLLVSPQYLFWSRTFMIESAAVCLGMCYLAATLAIVEGRNVSRSSQLCEGSPERPTGAVHRKDAGRSLTDKPTAWSVGAAALAGGLAGAVKATTFAGFLLAASLLVWRDWRRVWPSWGRLVASATAAFAVPVVVTMLWTRFADAQRAANPVASTFLLPSQLTDWTLGSLALRGDAKFWHVLAARTVPDAIGHWGLGLAATLAVLLAPQRWRLAAACGGLFLSAPLIFGNLHYVHNYYACANSLFLVGAVSCAIVALLERSGWRQVAGGALLLAAATTDVWAYLHGYYVAQRQDHPQELARVLEQITAPDDVLLMYGQDWAPVVPYYAHRRALMDRRAGALDAPPMRAALQGLGSYRIGAVVFCGIGEHSDFVRQVLEKLPLQPSRVVRVGGCAVYVAGRSVNQ